jgi:protein-S-isoprenylcysteine O-methyltransferase Ste14
MKVRAKCSINTPLDMAAFHPTARTRAVLGSALWFVLAVGTVEVLVPWNISRWQTGPPLLGLSALRMLGGVLVAAGAWGVLDSFARFALEGLGSPAPMLPPRRLVVTGWYRRVRNPIYVAGVAAILGQGLVFGSTRTVIYGVAVWLGAHLVVRLYEEPGLRRRFGRDYERYCANVPRFRPWRA